MKIKSIFEKTKPFLLKYQSDIILFLGVVLISLLSFAMGYIVAKEGEKKPLQFEETTYEKLQNINSGSRDFRLVSGLEIVREGE